MDVWQVHQALPFYALPYGRFRGGLPTKQAAFYPLDTSRRTHMLVLSVGQQQRRWVRRLPQVVGRLREQELESEGLSQHEADFGVAP